MVEGTSGIRISVMCSKLIADDVEVVVVEAVKLVALVADEVAVVDTIGGHLATLSSRKPNSALRKGTNATRVHSAGTGVGKEDARARSRFDLSDDHQVLDKTEMALNKTQGIPSTFLSDDSAPTAPQKRQLVGVRYLNGLRNGIVTWSKSNNPSAPSNRLYRVQEFFACRD